MGRTGDFVFHFVISRVSHCVHCVPVRKDVKRVEKDKGAWGGGVLGKGKFCPLNLTRETVRTLGLKVLIEVEVN